MATAALLSLAGHSALATSSFSVQPGQWSAAATWQDGAVPDGTGSVIVNHAVALDVNFGPSTGGLYILNASLFLEPAVTLTVPNGGLLVYPGSTVSGPGLIEGAAFSILGLPGGTVTSTFDVTEINVYSGVTGTIRQGTASNLFIEPSNTLSIVQSPGQTDGLTLGGNVYFQFDDGTAKIALAFDPISDLHDWAFRWKGDHASYLTGLLDTQLTFSGSAGIGIFYDSADDYTYVEAAPQGISVPEPSVFALVAASGLMLARRRR